tara:strand:- start:6020 stop:6226 length:207 start_codon:yes stop_codon:yes gene_type:complete
MEKNELCADCKAKVKISEGIYVHLRLEPISRIHNHTIYKCQHCGSLLERCHHPVGWYFLPLVFQEQAI